MSKSFAVLLVLISLAVLASGCGRSKTYSGPGGKVTVTPEGRGKTVKVESKEGSYTVTGDQKRTISEAELGAPVYPGSKLMVEGDYSGSEQSQQPGTKQHVLVSSDSFEKVSAFYKAKLKNIKGEQNFSNGDNKMAMFTVGEDGKMMVHISWDAGEKRTMVQVIKQEPK